MSDPELICPCCGGETDNQDFVTGEPIMCTPCKEAELAREVLASTVLLIRQLCAGGR